MNRYNPHEGSTIMVIYSLYTPSIIAHGLWEETSFTTLYEHVLNVNHPDRNNIPDFRLAKMFMYIIFHTVSFTHLPSKPNQNKGEEPQSTAKQISENSTCVMLSAGIHLSLCQEKESVLCQKTLCQPQACHWAPATNQARRMFSPQITMRGRGVWEHQLPWPPISQSACHCQQEGARVFYLDSFIIVVYLHFEGMWRKVTIIIYAIMCWYSVESHFTIQWP